MAPSFVFPVRTAYLDLHAHQGCALWIVGRADLEKATVSDL